MIKSITIGDISIDCAKPKRTRDFYAALTGWEKRGAYSCPALAGDNGLCRSSEQRMQLAPMSSMDT